MGRTPRENHGLEIIQDIIEKEISSSFKTEDGRFIGIKEQPNPLAMPTKKEIKQIIKQTVHKQRSLLEL